MSTLTAYRRRLTDRARDLPPLAVDAAIAAACWSIMVFQASIDDLLTWWMPVAALANALPLIWRRRYPFTVTVVTGIGTMWLAMAELLGHLPAAQLVATYTFAALCPPVLRLTAVALSAVALALSILVPDDEVLNLGLQGIAFSVAYALGVSARARRSRIAMLEERARRLAGQREAAAARERTRIAREMHDIIAHSMSMIAIQAEAGPVVVRSDPGKAEEVFDTISATARESLAQLRRVLGVLRTDEAATGPPPDLDGLPALIAGFRHSGLDVTLAIGGEARRVPADLGATAYRIVQESLTNTVKHAGAASATVRLEWAGSALRLEICDDGPGEASAGPVDELGRGRAERAGHGPESPAGHGLIGMRERVAAADGELTAGPGDGGVGFRVTASLPLP
ncbi:sensor histidine kinase [Actinomadura rubrisoli]|uniref:histidine kinase n=1 Tax=Actinomadura rubrisoli TaxID=2530368 RepID=A0A4R5BXZ7_9ACTN|nr:sensor histidine kinase [Actinomadura rubrisoli]TDD89264.1 sensor histidine kinase [Actinomadura rubrisoli]